jgi:hypothetical protein
VRVLREVFIAVASSALTATLIVLFHDRLARPLTNTKPVSASALSLIDAKGRTRIVLNTEGNSPSTRFLDANGTEKLVLKASDGRTSIRFGARASQPDIEMAVDRNGLLGPALLMSSPNAKINLVLGNAPAWDFPPLPGSGPERWGLVLYQRRTADPLAGILAMRQPPSGEYQGLLFEKRKSPKSIR